MTARRKADPASFARGLVDSLGQKEAEAFARDEARRLKHGFWPEVVAVLRRRQNPASPYEARLQAALLTPAQFPGRHVLEKLARLPDPASLAYIRGRRSPGYHLVPSHLFSLYQAGLAHHEPWAGYVPIRELALAELRARLGFKGTSVETAEAWKAYHQYLMKKIESNPPALHFARTEEELRTSPAARYPFQGRLDHALELAIRGQVADAEKELKRILKNGPPELAALLEHRHHAAPRRRNPSSVSRKARLQAALLVPTRFKGRKENVIAQARLFAARTDPARG